MSATDKIVTYYRIIPIMVNENPSGTPVSDFDYELPQDLIAQHPAKPRESARLLVLSRTAQTVSHQLVSDLPGFFRKGDVLVVNNSRVFKARLPATVMNPGNSYPRGEVFLIRPVGDGMWLTIGRPGRKLKVGTELVIADDFQGTVTAKNPDGTFHVSFGMPADRIIALADRYGHVPVPPYIKSEPPLSAYQTSYAKITGSVAAPTAGFHLTSGIRDRLKRSGVEFHEITLHVGLGTFMPVKTDTIEAHAMHKEWVSVSAETAEAITAAKKEGRRIIAAGTTTVRTLEGVASVNGGRVTAYEGDVNLFITPGFVFSVVDGMLTNFHLPKSTLIVLVSAFAGREKILKAYREAVRKRYRFYSFGDAMLILP